MASRAIPQRLPAGLAKFTMGWPLGDREFYQKLALTTPEIAALPDIPHFYFDKNVVIRFALFEMFRANPDPSSVQLVEAVIKRKIRATVSTLIACKRSTAIWDTAWSGPKKRAARGMDPAETEALARKYIGNLFFEQKRLMGLPAV